MWFKQWLHNRSFSGYDRDGNAKFLLGRSADPKACEMEGVPAEARDTALALLCEAFDIPQGQLYCLRPNDDLMALYASFVGPRSYDEMQFERLGIAIDELPGEALSASEAEVIRTVADVIRVVASRRGQRVT
jgi:hypothetical protein